MNFRKNNKNILPVLYLVVFIIFVNKIVKIKYPFSNGLEINFNYSSDGFLTSEVWTIGNDNNFCYSFTYEYLF